MILFLFDILWIPFCKGMTAKNNNNYGKNSLRFAVNESLNLTKLIKIDFIISMKKIGLYIIIILLLNSFTVISLVNPVNTSFFSGEDLKHFEKIENHIEINGIDSVQEYFDKTVGASNYNIIQHYYLKKGIDYIIKKEYDQAHNYLFKALEQGDYKGIYKNIGIVLYKKGFFSPSEDYFLEELKIFKDPTVFEALIKLNIENKNLDRAYFYANQFKAAQNDFTAYFLSGKVNYLLGFYKNAVNDIELAYRKNKEFNFQAWWYYFKSLLRTGQFKQSAGILFKKILPALFVTVILFIIMSALYFGVAGFVFFIVSDKSKGRAGYRDLIVILLISYAAIIWGAVIAPRMLLTPLNISWDKLETNPLFSLPFMLFVGHGTIVFFSWFLFYKRFGKGFIDGFKLYKPEKKYLYKALLYAVIMLLTAYIIDWMDVVPEFEDEFDQIPNTPLALLLILFTGSVLVPFFEECVFRGVLFQFFRERYSFVTTAIVTSFLFNLIHMPQYEWNIYVSIVIFGGSLLKAHLTKKSDSIIPAIIMHGYYNMILFIGMHT